MSVMYLAQCLLTSYASVAWAVYFIKKQTLMVADRHEFATQFH